MFTNTMPLGTLASVPALVRMCACVPSSLIAFFLRDLQQYSSNYLVLCAFRVFVFFPVSSLLFVCRLYPLPELLSGAQRHRTALQLFCL